MSMALPAGPLPLLGRDGRNPRPIDADPEKDYLSARYYGDVGVWMGGVWSTIANHAQQAAGFHGVRLYREMMTDPAVASAVRILKSAILAEGLQLVAAVQEVVEDDDGELTAEEQAELRQSDDILAFCQRCIDGLDRPIEFILWELLDAIVYGVKLGEIVWDVPETGEDEGKLVLKDIKVKNQYSWGFVVDRYWNVLGIRPLLSGTGRGTDSGRDVTARGDDPVLPRDKFVILSWMTEDGDLRGTSSLVSAYTAWNQKILIPAQRWIYLSRFAVPSLYGTTAPNAQRVPILDSDGNETGKYKNPAQAMLAGLVSIQNGTAAAGPNGSDVKVIESRGRGEAFATALDDCRREILMAILNTAMGAMESQHFSRANAESGQDLTSTFVRIAKRWVGSMFRRDALMSTVEKNFGADAARKYTPFVQVGMVELQDFSRNANAISTLADAGVVTGEMRSNALGFLGIGSFARAVRRRKVTPMAPAPNMPPEPKPIPGDGAAPAAA